jgi:sporulation protein YlmC with PRC-barrel domain
VNTGLVSLRLVRLSDASLALANEAADIRGKRVVDEAGYEMGRVDDLVTDDAGRRVYFMILKASGFIPGEKQLIIPVDTIRQRAGDDIYVDEDHERVAAGPEYDPTLLSDAGYQAGVYGWYGLTPYWHARYAPPAGWSQRLEPHRRPGQSSPVIGRQGR